MRINYQNHKEITKVDQIFSGFHLDYSRLLHLIKAENLF